MCTDFSNDADMYRYREVYFLPSLPNHKCYSVLVAEVRQKFPLVLDVLGNFLDVDFATLHVKNNGLVSLHFNLLICNLASSSCSRCTFL